MSEWKKVKLGDICEIKSGKRLPKGSDFSSIPTEYKYIRARDIKNGIINDDELVYISEEVKQKISKYIVNTNDIVITIVGASIGDVAYVTSQFDGVNLTENAVRLTNFINHINSHYIFYILNSPDYYMLMQRIAGGAAQPKMGIYKVEAIEVTIPSLHIQDQVVAVLSRYDSLIENYQKQIKLLEEAAQRLYKEWFVDLHFPGHENTKIVDGVPEGWEKKLIGEVCDTTSGGTPSRSKTDFYTGNIPWVKTKELNDDFIFDTEERITDDAIRKSSAKLIPSGSILMAMYGATIGKLGIATKELSCNQACCVFLLSEDNTLRFYIYSWLLDNRTLLISMGKGAAQPNLSQDMIKKLEIMIPSLHLLSIFDSKVKSIYKKIYYLSSQIRLLTEARDRLLPKLMSGEIELDGERPEKANNRIDQWQRLGE